MLKTNVIKKNYIFICTHKNTGEKKRMEVLAESLESALLKINKSSNWEYKFEKVDEDKNKGGK